MARGNPQTGNTPNSKLATSNWPGKVGNNESFPEDIHKRWYPTSWGAGCGPDLTANEKRARSLGISKPSFEIGASCPNCGIAKLSLDADEFVSCPLCLFGGLCDCEG